MHELDDFIMTNILPLFFINYTDEIETLSCEKNIVYLQIKDIYHKIKKFYFTQYYPIRSFHKTFIRKYPNIDIIQKKISIIRNKYQPEQKSDEWYIFRHKIITASSAWKVFKTQSYIPYSHILTFLQFASVIACTVYTINHTPKLYTITICFNTHPTCTLHFIHHFIFHFNI